MQVYLVLMDPHGLHHQDFQYAIFFFFLNLSILIFKSIIYLYNFFLIDLDRFKLMIDFFLFFKLPADQIKSVLVAITDSGKFQGVTLNGERYIMVRNDPTFCILKKGGNGIVASKSNQGISII